MGVWLPGMLMLWVVLSKSEHGALWSCPVRDEWESWKDCPPAETEKEAVPVLVWTEVWTKRLASVPATGSGVASVMVRL